MKRRYVVELFSGWPDNVVRCTMKAGDAREAAQRGFAKLKRRFWLPAVDNLAVRVKATNELVDKELWRWW